MKTYFFLFSVLLIDLKLFEFVNWSWWIILAPIYLIMIFWFTLGFFEGIFAELFGKKTRRARKLA